MRIANIPLGGPCKLGITKTKREREIIISLTSHPPRIGSEGDAILDRIIHNVEIVLAGKLNMRKIESVKD